MAAAAATRVGVDSWWPRARACARAPRVCALLSRRFLFSFFHARSPLVATAQRANARSRLLTRFVLVYAHSFADSRARGTMRPRALFSRCLLIRQKSMNAIKTRTRPMFFFVARFPIFKAKTRCFYSLFFCSEARRLIGRPLQNA